MMNLPTAIMETFRAESKAQIDNYNKAIHFYQQHLPVTKTPTNNDLLILATHAVSKMDLPEQKRGALSAAYVRDSSELTLQLLKQLDKAMTNASLKELHAEAMELGNAILHPSSHKHLGTHLELTHKTTPRSQ